RSASAGYRFGEREFRRALGSYQRAGTSDLRQSDMDQRSGSLGTAGPDRGADQGKRQFFSQQRFYDFARVRVAGLLLNGRRKRVGSRLELPGDQRLGSGAPA